MNDIDAGGEFEMIGELETTMGAIMHARKKTFIDKLSFEGTSKKRGIIIVRAEPVEESK